MPETSKDAFNTADSKRAKDYEHYLHIAESEIKRSDAFYTLGYVNQCVSDMKELGIDIELQLKSGETDDAKKLLESTRNPGHLVHTYASGNLRLGHALYPIAFTSKAGDQGNVLYILSQADANGKRWPHQYSAITLESLSSDILRMAAAEEALKSFAPGGKNSWVKQILFGPKL